MTGLAFFPHPLDERLGLDPTCSDEDIRKAYRRQALMHHPDRHDPERREEAAERFRHATEAYEKLNDPDSRRAHDQATSRSRRRSSRSRDFNDFYDVDGDGFVTFDRGMERNRFPSHMNRHNNNRQRQRRNESAFDIFDEMRAMQSSLFPSMFNEHFGMRRGNIRMSTMEEMMRGFDSDFNDFMNGMHSFSGDSFFNGK